MCFSITLYLLVMSESETSSSDSVIKTTSPETKPFSQAIQINNITQNDNRSGTAQVNKIDSPDSVSEAPTLLPDKHTNDEESNDQISATGDAPYKSILPGEDVNFDLDIYSSTHHMIEGNATSDIGDILFKSRLLPSNEVELSINLEQNEFDGVELVAYVDLANFTMEMDGANSVLNVDHKQVLKHSSSHLQSSFEQQYKDYDAPEHALVLIRMIAYWSMSPEGFVHEKRSIVSE